MQQIIAIFKRDVVSSFRDNIIIYTIIAPFLLAVGLKLFIPGVNAASLQFAIDEKSGSEVISEFKKYGRVEVYSKVNEIENRVLNIDDVAGITKDNNDIFKVILEGNEAYDTKFIPYKIIRTLENNYEYDVDYVVNDIGFFASPAATAGTASLLIAVIIIGGMLIGFNIIEEKENQTIQALNVTPVSKFKIIAGKSLLGLLLPLVNIYIILGLLEMLDVNLLMVLAMTVASSFIALIFGFLMGVLSSNQISGIANMKLLSMVFSIVIIGAILLPADKQFFLYWAPPYWSFIGFKGIILKAVSWEQIGIYVGWILGLTGLIFLLLKNRINRGLM